MSAPKHIPGSSMNNHVTTTQNDPSQHIGLDAVLAAYRPGEEINTQTLYERVLGRLKQTHCADDKSRGNY